MDKLKFLSGIEDIDRKNLFSLIFDRIKKNEFSGEVTFTPFLSPADCIVLEKKLSQAHFENFSSFGGTDAAERRMFAFGNCDNEDFPIDTLKIFTRDKSVFEHRDYLGSCLSLGIKREKLGDILISDGASYVFASSDISDFLTLNLKKIAHSNVECIICGGEKLPDFEKKYNEVSKTVTSLRLDCVVSAFCSKSRAVSDALICEGRVFLNYECVKNLSKQVSNNDVLTVRGFGKGIILTDFPLTKKNKRRICVKYYV